VILEGCPVKGPEVRPEGGMGEVAVDCADEGMIESRVEGGGGRIG
jgi:hypothetical protein